MFNVDTLAQEIRRVNGDNTLGAAALAEALMPFITKSAKKQSFDDVLTSEFKRRYAGFMADTDIEDDRAARVFAADEAFAELMDILTDVRMKARV